MEEERPDLTSRVYNLIVTYGREGILQSDLWKELGLTSRDGSRLAIKLEKRGIIKRDKILDDGRWTYRLIPLRLPVQIKSIEFSPCIICDDEGKCSPNGIITPYKCVKLEHWVLQEYKEK
jgi:hypothetical protein